MIVAAFKDLVRCISGPRLHMIYGRQQVRHRHWIFSYDSLDDQVDSDHPWLFSTSAMQDPKYKANVLEYFTDTILSFELLPVNHPSFVTSCYLFWTLLRGGHTQLVTGWSPERLKSLITNLSAYLLLMGLTYLSRGL
jgi:hypothetical protein